MRFPQAILSLAIGAGLTALLGLTPTPAGADGGSVGVLVLKEHGVGSAAQAQPYVDRFVALAATQNGWSGAKGKYTTSRSAAEAFIQSDRPQYGILSLGGFLAMKSKHNLEVIGQVVVSRAGGQQYHLISKTATDAAGCKGKTLATDHADDAKFIEKVVMGGKMTLSEFTLVQTTRPVQTIKKVTGGEAECALIDDAQFQELSRLKDAQDVRSVWKSDKLPPMVVVAFPGAADRKGFQGSLGKLCTGSEATACSEVGISTLKSASDGDYAALVATYK